LASDGKSGVYLRERNQKKSIGKPEKERTGMKKWQEDFLAGQLWHAHEYLGALKVEEGYCFRVWAPHAAAVSVIGSFNNWQPDALPMREIGAGIWEAVCPNAAQNDEYKYLITTHNGREI